MTFWRQAEVHDPMQAAALFLQSSWHSESGAMETWAAENCQKAGGTVVTYTEYLRPTSSVQLCEFADRSAIETWTLLAGPDAYPRLGELIRSAH